MKDVVALNYGKNHLETENRKWRCTEEDINREDTTKHNKSKQTHTFWPYQSHDSMIKNM